MGTLIALCGLTAVLIGGWRSYVLAREAVAPFGHGSEGDPTRSAIESARPVPMRPRVRRFVRAAILSVGWLVVSFYGLYLVVAGGELTR